jgi:hypothetical protein
MNGVGMAGGARPMNRISWRALRLCERNLFSGGKAAEARFRHDTIKRHGNNADQVFFVPFVSFVVQSGFASPNGHKKTGQGNPARFRPRMRVDQP